MPLVNCGEGGKRQIAKRINCERRGKWQSYEPRERKEREREGRQCIINLRRNTPRSLAWRLEECASLSLSQKHLTWGMFKINTERSSGPPSTTTTDGTTGK